MKKKIVILGSTGSIGVNTLAVIDHFPRDFKVLGLTAGNNIELLSKQIKKYLPVKVAVLKPDKAQKLKGLLGKTKTKILSGLEGLIELATHPEVEVVVMALAGSIGLKPLFEAVRKGKTIALANKEPLVMAGELLMAEAKRFGAKIIPVDSEHSALFQCLEGKDKDEAESLILTCSGGPFYRWPKEKLSHITPEMALRHPVWKMGKKITIDSATLMNKGLEIIEATHLFGVDLSRIKVVIHPEAIVHGLVQFRDGILLGVLGQPDMRLAIQYALHYPRRPRNLFPRLDLSKARELTFYPPDEKKFPGLGLAREACRLGGTATVVFNGANEVAVESFLRREIRFLDIPVLVSKVMKSHEIISHPSLEKILAADNWSREEAKRLIHD